MTEENNQMAEQQSATAQAGIERNADNQSAVQTSSEQRPSDGQDQNWREVRSIMREQRQRIEELEGRLKTTSQPQPKEEEDDFSNLSPDDVVTVADMQRYANSVAKKTARQIYEERAKEQEFASTPSKYSDYNDVIQYVEPLIKQNPALLGAIQNAPNPREAAYHIAKMYVATQNTSSQENAKKIEENLSKPKTSDTLANSSGFDPAHRSGVLSLEEKSKIWEQAQKYASMR